NYNTAIGADFNVNSILGFNSNQRTFSSLRANITNLDIPNFYELSNSSVKPVVLQNDAIRKSFGAFASIETSYKNRVFLTLTGRNDWTSTLPMSNNSYFYPSASLSGIVLDTPDYFLKLRAGYAALANDTDPYQTESALSQGSAFLGFGNIFLPFGGVNGYEFATTLGNENLKPERVNELEFGFETNLFKKRVNIDATYYNKKSEGILVSRPLAASTGFGFQTTNLIDLTNKGVELVLNVVPIRTKDFEWDFTTTFTKNESEVTGIAGGLQSVELGSNFGITFNAVVGQPLGVFKAIVPKTNDTGQYIVDPGTGFYANTTEQQAIGDSQRDFILGFKNKVSYKGLSLTFGLDWKQGGEMYSYTKRLSHFTGNGIETTYNDRNPFIIPNSVVEIKNAAGVVTGYAENTNPIAKDRMDDYWNASSNAGIEQGHIIDKTFVRLRDVALTFNFPSAPLKRLGLANASFTIYGKNLALWTPKDNPYVDPELSTFGDGLLSEQGEFGTNPSQRSYGASIKLTF
ncbi:MAG TPA: TonB-dependent receptor, partial [Cytophagaceae bacterium]